jgi:SpoVK/Ycf46/Vps4 family AAA+-type ATPase
MMSKRPRARIKRFKPGDLITADDLNRMIDAIETLEQRIAALEGKCSPRHILYVGPRRARAAAAAALARTEGRDLYRVDLAALVSKYIGETEKNLDAAFAEAEKSGAILFFDEADALFGKRSEVKDAHDRYANLELNYLLQRLETFDGLAILGLKRSRKVDLAFSGRFDAVVELRR